MRDNESKQNDFRKNRRDQDVFGDWRRSSAPSVRRMIGVSLAVTLLAGTAACSGALSDAGTVSSDQPAPQTRQKTDGTPSGAAEAGTTSSRKSPTGDLSDSSAVGRDRATTSDPGVTVGRHEASTPNEASMQREQRESAEGTEALSNQTSTNADDGLPGHASEPNAHTGTERVASAERPADTAPAGTDQAPAGTVHAPAGTDQERPSKESQSASGSPNAVRAEKPVNNGGQSVIPGKDPVRAQERHVLKVRVKADTYSSSAAPRRTHGGLEKTVAMNHPGPRKVSFLKFRVKGLPKDAHVITAHVRLHRTDHHLPRATFYLATVKSNKWREATLTAKNAPSRGRQIDTTRTTRSASVLSLAAGQVVDGNGTYSFAVTTRNGAGFAIFHSKESGRKSPVLKIVYRDDGTKTQPPPPESDTCTVSAILVPSCGVWFGSGAKPKPGQSRAADFVDVEHLLRTKLDIVHVYVRNSDSFPEPSLIRFAREPGTQRLLYLDWKPENGHSWAEVARGASDALIDRESRYLKEHFRDKFFLSIHHEPEDEVVPTPGSGYTATDFRNMFRHVVHRLRANGVHNAVFVMNYMGAQKWGITSWFDDLYPGDRYVDWIAFDPYATTTLGRQDGGFDLLANMHWGDNPKWHGSYRWASQHHPNKPIMWGEWGVAEKPGDPSWKPWFFGTVTKDLPHFPRIKALVYFHPGSNESVRVDSSQRSLEAFRKLAQAPVFTRQSP